MAEDEGSVGAVDDSGSEAATGGLLTATGGVDEVGGALVDATDGVSGDEAGVCAGAEGGVVGAWATAGVAAGTVLGVATFTGGESDCVNQ